MDESKLWHALNLQEVGRRLPKLTLPFNLKFAEPSRHLASLHSCWQVEDGAGDRGNISSGNTLKVDVDLEISFGTCQRLL